MLISHNTVWIFDVATVCTILLTETPAPPTPTPSTTAIPTTEEESFPLYAIIVIAAGGGLVIIMLILLILCVAQHRFKSSKCSIIYACIPYNYVLE